MHCVSSLRRRSSVSGFILYFNGRGGSVEIDYFRENSNFSAVQSAAVVLTASPSVALPPNGPSFRTPLTALGCPPSSPPSSADWCMKRRSRLRAVPRADTPPPPPPSNQIPSVTLGRPLQTNSERHADRRPLSPAGLGRPPRYISPVSSFLHSQSIVLLPLRLYTIHLCANETIHDCSFIQRMLHFNPLKGRDVNRLHLASQV